MRYCDNIPLCVVACSQWLPQSCCCQTHRCQSKGQSNGFTHRSGYPVAFEGVAAAEGEAAAAGGAVAAEAGAADTNAV